MPTSKRPCQICRCWFEPDPREGNRQRVCSRDTCQRERHRRNCVAGRAADKKRAREKLLAKRLVAVDDRVSVSGGAEVIGGRSRDSVTLKGTVEVRELLKVITSSPRDSVASKTKDEPSAVPKVIAKGPRDDTDGGDGPP